MSTSSTTPISTPSARRGGSAPSVSVGDGITAGPASATPAVARAGTTTTTGAQLDARSSVTSGVRTASEWTWRLGVIVLGLYGFSRVFGRFSEILIPVLVALLLSALLHPVADRMRGLPRPLAAILTMLGTLLLIVALFALVGQQASSGFPELRTQGVNGIAKVQDWLASGPLHISANALSGVTTKAKAAVTENQSSIASGALGIATSVTHLAAGFAITMFSTFFFLSSGHRIWAWLLRILPRRAQTPLDDAARSGWVTLSHYVRATLIVAFVDGLGVGIGTAILGVPLALPLGVVVFLGAFIPVIGALLTGVLAILVALVAKGPVVALIVLGIVIAVNQLEAHILQPFLLGRAVEVHPLAVILSLAAGATLAGIVGALFAVPIAAVGNTMITSLAGRRGDDPGDREARDPAPLSPDKPGATDVDKTVDTQQGSVTGAPTGR
jgi:predicted PurR-regulated permease PerM